MKIIHNIKEFVKENQDNPNESGRPKIHSFMDMDTEEMNSINLEIFELIKEKTMQVAYGYANSLIITGQSGVGKTFDVLDTLKKANQIEGKDYILNAGNISPSGLFEELFINHDRLLVFDDCDSVLEDVNTLKAALDSNDPRVVTRKLKTHFSVVGMTMRDIMANYEGDESMAENKDLFDKKNKGKLPKKFLFTGRIIFISNKKQDEINDALITRSTASIDVDLTHEEVLVRLRSILKSMKPGVPEEMKEEVLNLVDYLTMKYKTRHELSIRTVGNAIDTRVSNDKRYKEINGKTYPLWAVMVKQDLVGKTAIPRD